MGAEVLKIESAARPDLLRLDPTRGRVEAAPNLDRSTAFLSLNCSKYSCTLNLTTAKGVDLARQIIAASDVVVENYSVGVMARFGLDYPSLRRLKPDIIMLSISGPGQTGPDRNEVAYATTIHAFTGLCATTGHPGGPPVQVGGMWADVITGQMATFALLAALYRRRLTGEGQYIDVAMNEAMLAVIPEGALDFALTGRTRRSRGNQDEIMAPHGCYPCAGEDQWIAIAVANDEQWQALCNALGRPAWCADPKFADQYSRWRYQEEIDPQLAAWTRHYPPREAMQILQAAGVPAGIMARPADTYEDPHLRQRGFFLPMEHPAIGRGELARLPFRADDAFVGRYVRSPLLGEHNSYVFGELLGLDQKEIESLVEERVIF
jgi:crotonobetainyl-CoA:carnitine CoA-transferase CaiB-like acyl-CoA transferase